MIASTQGGVERMTFHLSTLTSLLAPPPFAPGEGWWRRWESNPRPKSSPSRALRNVSCVLVSSSGRPQAGSPNASSSYSRPSYEPWKAGLLIWLTPDSARSARPVRRWPSKRPGRECCSRQLSRCAFCRVRATRPAPDCSRSPSKPFAPTFQRSQALPRPVRRPHGPPHSPLALWYIPY